MKKNNRLFLLKRRSLLCIGVLLQFSAHSQYKRFAVESNVSYGTFNERGSYENYELNHFGYSGRIQYNFPWVFSLNAAFGQEHQSYVNISKNDMPVGYVQTSDIRTSERFTQLALRATFGNKICLYLDAGVQYSFKGKAAVDAYVDYWNEDPDHQNHTLSYEQSLDNPYAYYEKDRKWDHFQLFYGVGLKFPIYRALHAFVEYRSHVFASDESYVVDDKLYLPGIAPYSRGRIAFGLSYHFNMKKDSDFLFKTVYLKPIKNTQE